MFQTLVFPVELYGLPGMAFKQPGQLPVAHIDLFCQVFDGIGSVEVGSQDLLRLIDICIEVIFKIEKSVLLAFRLHAPDVDHHLPGSLRGKQWIGPSFDQGQGHVNTRRHTGTGVNTLIERVQAILRKKSLRVVLSRIGQAFPMGRTLHGIQHPHLSQYQGARTDRAEGYSFFILLLYPFPGLPDGPIHFALGEIREVDTGNTNEITFLQMQVFHDRQIRKYQPLFRGQAFLLRGKMKTEKILALFVRFIKDLGRPRQIEQVRMGKKKKYNIGERHDLTRLMMDKYRQLSVLIRQSAQTTDPPFIFEDRPENKLLTSITLKS